MPHDIQGNASPNRHGRWYVRYPDGHETFLMPRSEARDLAAIFGGQVFYLPPVAVEHNPAPGARRWWQFWRK